MDTPILTTKLHVPPLRPSLVSRLRLIERLDEGLRSGHRLILVSAPAGFGKTTLLSEWINAGAESRTASSTSFSLLPAPSFAWCSLDEGDDDPLNFWTYVVAALQTVHPPLGQSVQPMLQGPQLPPVRAIVTPLVNDLAALSEPVVLVLDDYHLVAGGAIHDGVAAFLDHLPRRAHLVIATRADPPLPIARLRARGQLTELRADDLRFTPEEVTAFLNDVMGLALAPGDVAALETRTEGWIAGLHLAALSLRGRQDAHSFVEAFTGSHHYVLEYLIEEVLGRQPEPVQRFLLQTSVLDRLCASLCDEVTGGQDGGEMLGRLERDNLFVVPLDEERRWYRTHRLFGDLLGKRLGQSHTDEKITELHRRASRWHEENGLLEQAVRHARAAGDFERVAEIAERTAGASLLDARLTTLLRWVDVLPEDVLRAHPRLQVYRAWALFMNGHLEAAGRALHTCRQGLEALSPMPEDDTLRQDLIRLLDTIDLISRGLLGSVDNRLQEAIEMCGRAREMALADGRILLAAQATEGLALARYHQGRLHASARLCREVVQLAERVVGPRQAPLAAAGYIELAGLHLEWNELDAAAEKLDRAWALCQKVGATQTLTELHRTRSRLLQAQGDPAAARQALEEARESSSAEGEYSMAHFRIGVQQAWLDLEAGQPEQIVTWVQGVEATFEAEAAIIDMPVAFGETMQAMLARACLAQGRPQAALDVLDPLLPAAEAAGASLRVVEVCALRALALQALGDTGAALASLQRSLTLAQPEGFTRVYLDEGPPMAHLLRQAAAQGVAMDYVNRLLDALPPHPHTPPPPPPHSYTLALVEPLTPRELDVLRLLCQGLSNQQIADELVIALNTVKRHASNIYGKLGVKSRTQAVVRARELGLLSST